MRTTTCCAALAAVGMLCLAGPALGVDQVILKRSKESRKGKVLRDDSEGVELRLVRGGTVKFNREDVQEVIYDEGRPAQYGQGVQSYNRGDYQLALSQLEGARDQRHEKLLKQYILYHLGLAQKKLKDVPGAIKSFETLRALGKETRFLTEAYRNLVTLSLDAGDPAAAKKYLYEYLKLIGGGQSSPEIDLMKALIEEKQKNYRPAIVLYRKAGAHGGDVGAQAELGIARCLVASKRPEEAAKRIKELVKRPISAELHGQAYVLLGDLLKAKARSPDDWEGALLAYLRVPLLYGGNEETEAKALYEAAYCYRRTEHKQKDARAGTLTRLLKGKYAGSPYAKKAP